MHVVDDDQLLSALDRMFAPHEKLGDNAGHAPAARDCRPCRRGPSGRLRRRRTRARPPPRQRGAELIGGLGKARVVALAGAAVNADVLDRCHQAIWAHGRARGQDRLSRRAGPLPARSPSRSPSGRDGPPSARRRPCPCRACSQRPVDWIAALAAARIAESSICLGRNSLMTAISALLLLGEFRATGVLVDRERFPDGTSPFSSATRVRRRG